MRWVKTKIATINDNFKDRASDAPHFAKRRHVLMLQETKHTRLRELLPEEYGVFQRDRWPGQANSAIVWQRKAGEVLGRGYELLVDARGVRMEDRWIAWIDFRRKGSDQIVRYATAHFPPSRFDHLDPKCEEALRRFTKASPYPVVIGMDSNHRGGPRVRPPGTRWKGVRIDGFVFSARLRLRRVFALPFQLSDHRPVRAVVMVRACR